MKQFIVVFLCVFVLAGCIPQIAEIIMPPKSEQPARHPAQQQEVAPVDLGNMKIGALFAEYNQNKVAAEKKYLGKGISVTGNITYITEMPFNGGYALDIEESGWEIGCYFENSQENSILALKEGQKITVFGVIRATNGFPHPDLEKCRIVKP